MSERLSDGEDTVVILRDTARWMMSLADEAFASRKLLADLLALHWRQAHMPSCYHCGLGYPCPTVRLIQEAGA